ncbi:hypothetical protein ymoll0001_37000 [Yersinia mollaretii ATCC 43969]|uniref:Uncharacterized protein n=1 Tax=Yersinia mollaretii (strain ATCC 43969 / DSM 18520 / CIP 103324 / CNY 7263 / WAIP 204) TaxID=349967 RepID=A0ABP2EC07_YERMW|nr:hypothetical protein ymoll0001_37000 [Yersinia mollaretii ATCC 43969]
MEMIQLHLVVIIYYSVSIIYYILTELSDVFHNKFKDARVFVSWLGAGVLNNNF